VAFTRQTKALRPSVPSHRKRLDSRGSSASIGVECVAAVTIHKRWRTAPQPD
jgi:hypothetical protein